MGKQHGEAYVYSRNVGLKYRATFNSDNYVVYEGWAYPKTKETDTKWQIAKHTRDSNGNLTAFNWADSSDDFKFSWALRADYAYE